MKVPKSFKLKGNSWKLVRVDNLKDEDADPAMGLTDRANRIVELDRNLSSREQSLTFWHETTHAALFEAHITDAPGGLSEILEHIICEAVAEAVVSIVGEFK